MAERLTWRQRMAPLIAQTLKETAGQPEKVIRRALRETWNDAGFGERAMHPYKTWCDEVRRQRGLKKSKRPKKKEIDERQPTLF